jgi:hypothetical protein
MLAPLPQVDPIEIDTLEPTTPDDPLPEHARYRDTGCEVSPSCLRCPLARCRYDTPGGLTAIRRMARDARILALREQELSVREIARATGLATRTIQRAFRRNGL